MVAKKKSIFEDTLIWATGIGPLHYPKNHRTILGAILRHMALTNLSKKFNMSGKLLWKQPVRWIVENGILKI